MMFEKNFNITAFLFIILALSTWLDLNGVWVELPLIINRVPEGWALPSQLSLAVAVSNTAPVIIMLLKFIFKQRLDERIFIYIEIIVGIGACGLMAQYWNKTSYVAGAQRSVLFIIFVFLLGTLDTTSTVTYSDYMKRYNAKLLNALLLGESLTSLIPSILASIQGIGGEPVCSLNSTQPEYAAPRFSVQVYFWIFAAIIFSSLIAFLILEWSNIAQSYRTENYKTSNTSQLSLQTDSSYPTPMDASFVSMSTRMYYSLLALAYFTSIILFGILPSIGTYVMLPYSQYAYYISSIVLPISNPLSVIIALVGTSRLGFYNIIALCFTATCTTV
jgi:riboflavin transporter 2